MRAVLHAGLVSLAALAAVPAASAGVPEPLCQVPCMIVFNVVLPCANAEAQQDVDGQGDGCPLVNGVQDGLDCFVRAIEAQADLAEPCPA